MNDDEKVFVVCPLHRRFVPCRRGEKWTLNDPDDSSCSYSSEPVDVLLTIAWQWGQDDAEAYAASHGLDYVQPDPPD